MVLAFPRDPEVPALAPKTALEPRKRPRQARSVRTNAVLLEAAARVLAREGPARFNTNRVAEVAGVSVGTLYQYYPNKAALLVQLDLQDSRESWGEIECILADEDRGYRERVGAAVRRFFESEAAEAELRASLRRAEAFFERTPAYRAREARAVATVRGFLRRALPRRRRADLDFQARFFTTAVSSLAERVTDRGAGPAELRRWADACSAMLCDHLGIV